MPRRFYDKASSLTHAQVNRLIIACLLILFFLVLAKQLSNAFFTFYYQSDTPLNNNAALVDPPNDYNVVSITSSQLFGQFEGQDIGSMNIPVTNLELKLRGAFTSSQPRLSSAMIEGPDGETRSYRVNSKVYGQTELKQVFSDRVVLSRNGELETLYFPASELSDVSSNNNQLSQSAVSGYEIPNDIRSLVQDNMTGQEIQQAAKQLISSAMTPEQRKALIRQRLEDLRNRAKQRK